MATTYVMECDDCQADLTEARPQDFARLSVVTYEGGLVNHEYCLAGGCAGRLLTGTPSEYLLEQMKTPELPPPPPPVDETPVPHEQLAAQDAELQAKHDRERRAAIRKASRAKAKAKA